MSAQSFLPLLASSLLIASCGAIDRAEPARERIEDTTQAILAGQEEPGHSETVLLVQANADATEIALMCTVVFVTKRLALTASHCVYEVERQAATGSACDASGSAKPDHYGAPIAPIRVRVFPAERVIEGNEFVSKESYGVAKITGPDLEPGRALCGNDIAMIELSDPLDEITPAPVRITRPVAVGEPITVVGYGNDGKKEDAGRRRSRKDVKVEIVGQSASPTDPKKTKSLPSEWVSDHGGCGGDSGSPAFDQEGNLVGVMSRGAPRECVGMVYTSVDEKAGFGQFIVDTVREVSTRTGDDLPTWAQTPSSAAPDAGASASPSDASAPTTDASSGGCQTAPSESSFHGLAFGSLISILLTRTLRRRPGRGAREPIALARGLCSRRHVDGGSIVRSR